MLKNILNVKGVKALDKKDQKEVNGGRTRFCGGTGGMPINWPQSQCYGYGVQWYNGQC
ncbi:hypothetical protein U8527_15480 [Kordia algicida OT-1]|uniref:Uncharacterized protein n=1 Tax=Kordia algicida OT-1 TaxID=391587 RepID=A9E825_9FLAO|nr:hypothetical protein [Kordia algicida]EDP94958.1 hypothetical protein KAOT1_09094 [Kordia algicida OT-1]